MKAAQYLLAAVSSLIVLAAPGVARADDIVAATVSNLTYDGNNVCGASGTSLCSETFNVSFLWDNTTGAMVAGSLQASADGALGPFTFGLPTVGPVSTFFAVVLSGVDGDFDSWTMEYDISTTELTLGSYPLEAASAPGGLANALACPNQGPPCQSDFGHFVFASAGTAMVTPAPEPSSTILLGASVLGLMGIRRHKRQLA